MSPSPCRPSRTLWVLVSAGACGAASAAFGKLAARQAAPPARLACYLLLLVCNAAMVALYTRGLRSVSSLQATVTSVAANM